MSDIPPAPKGLSPTGAQLWASIVDEYELAEHELNLLEQACRTIDTLEQLQAVIDVDGVIDERLAGVRVHPAVIELRAQRLTLTKLPAALQLPAGLESGKVRARRDRWPVTGLAV